MSVQQLLRREWGPFNGLHSNQIGSAIPHGYAQLATNVRLDNGVIEVASGDAIFNTSLPAGTSNNHLFSIGLFQSDFAGLSADQLLHCTGSTWRAVTSSASNAIGHTTGTATFTNGSAIVTGSSTAWTTHLKAGDFIKLASGADSTYQEISTVDSATQVTLTSTWAGGTTSAAYISRITWSGSDNNYVCALPMNGVLLMSNRSDLMASYNGTSQDVVTTGPAVGCLEQHKSRMFGANTSGNPHRLFWSNSNAVTTWDTTNQQTDIYALDGTAEIEAIKSYKA